jgi:hypothetical protein
MLLLTLAKFQKIDIFKRTIVLPHNRYQRQQKYSGSVIQENNEMARDMIFKAVKNLHTIEHSTNALDH